MPDASTEPERTAKTPPAPAAHEGASLEDAERRHIESVLARVNWVIEFFDAGSWAAAWRVTMGDGPASVTGPISGPWPWVKLVVLADLDAEP